jgi:hypothetical protein
MRAMLLAVWIGLAVSLGAVLVGGWLALTQGLRTWRASRRLMRHMSAQLEAVSKSAAAAEEKAARANEKSLKLATALERLRRSQAELAVLREAVAEVSSSSAILRTLLARV